MAKVAIVQQVYKSRNWIPLVYPAILAQTYPDIQIICQIVDDEGGSKEFIQNNYPSVKIVEPGYNIGFAKGHNEIFAKSNAEFFQLVNPDLIIEPDYVEKMLKAFEDPKVGAVTGKLLRYDLAKQLKTNLIDTTGITVSKSGRGRDRGQLEEDHGQYDTQTKLIAVSGAGSMYRKSALEAVATKTPDGRPEYFDEDFHSYWEDVDLSLRMVNSGFVCEFVPKAMAYHGRTAGSSKGGYKNVFSFIRHHKQIPQWVRELNYKNHIFLVLKNFPKLYFKFFVREFFYQLYVLGLETTTLKILPKVWKQFPVMLRKRKAIAASRKISAEEFGKLLA